MHDEPTTTEESGETTTRRRVLRAAGALGAMGLTASVFREVASSGAIAATLSASDVSLSSDDGTITALTVAPSIDVTWSGLDSIPQSAALATTVSDPNDAQTTYTFVEQQFDVSSGTLSGSQILSMDSQRLLGGTPFQASDFESTTDGTDHKQSVRIEVGIQVNLADGTSERSTAGPADYAVTTTNAAATVSSGGTANTDGSA